MVVRQTRHAGRLNTETSFGLMTTSTHSPASLVLSVMASISSSSSDRLSSSSSDESSFMSNRAGMAGRVCILRAIPMLEEMAGESRDIGLLEQ